MPLIIKLTDAPAPKIYPLIDFTAHNAHHVDENSVKLINAVKEGGISKVEEVLRTLKSENPEALNNENDKQETPLSVAISEGNLSVCQLLIENGCDVNKDGKVPPFYLRLCPLSQAVVQNNFDLVKLLIHSDCLKDKVDVFGKSAISYAVSAGNLDIIKYLLSVGCSSNTQADNGYSLLHEACSKAHTEAVKILLDAGADTNAFEVRERTTPAFFSNQIPIHELLIQYGSDVNFVSHTGDTVLHNAIIHGNQDLVEFLLDKGALLTSKRMKLSYATGNLLSNFSFQDPLDLAAEQFHFNICETLIRHGSELLPLSIRPESKNLWYRILYNSDEKLIRVIYDDFIPLPGYTECVLSFTKLLPERKAIKWWEMDLLGKPQDLRNICRSVIRKQMRLSSNGSSIIRGIMQLPVPNRIKEYLTLNPSPSIYET